MSAIGHAKVRNDFKILKTVEHIDHNATSKGVSATLIPTRGIWDTKDIQMFTDGSKLKEAVYGGIFSEAFGVSRSIRLPVHRRYTEFQNCVQVSYAYE